MKKLIIYIIATLLFSIATYSQSSIKKSELPQKLGIYLKADKDTALIGDFVNLELVAAYPQNSKFNFETLKDSLKRNLRKYEIISISKTDTIIGSKNSDIQYQKAKYVVSSYEVGNQNISGFYNYYTTKNSNGDIDTSYINSNNLYINFMGVGADTTQTFKDIKPPIEVGFDYTDYILWSIFLIFLGGAIYWLVNYIKNKKPIEKKVESVTPNIPAHILAMEELKALENEKLWQNGKDKEYYTKLTEILRNYVEKVYYINSMEMTTDETMKSLRSIGMTDELLKLIEYILNKADFVKFAKYQSIAEDNISSMRNAIEFIKKSHN
jgi:hypothetical protein